MTAEERQRKLHAEILAERDRLREALECIVAAHNGNPTPIHYKVKEAIDRGREALGGEKDASADVICPRKRSEWTPCVVTDGPIAYADDGRCVGCWLAPHETGVPLAELKLRGVKGAT